MHIPHPFFAPHTMLYTPRHPYNTPLRTLYNTVHHSAPIQFTHLHPNNTPLGTPYNIVHPSAPIRYTHLHPYNTPPKPHTMQPSSPYLIHCLCTPCNIPLRTSYSTIHPSAPHRMHPFALLRSAVRKNTCHISSRVLNPPHPKPKCFPPLPLPQTLLLYSVTPKMYSTTRNPYTLPQ